MGACNGYNEPEIMKCSHCNRDFEEKDIHESHDVPCYLFYEEISRRLKKQKADKYPRRWLCKKCHGEYEKALSMFLKLNAEEFGRTYFKDDNNT